MKNQIEIALATAYNMLLSEGITPIVKFPDASIHVMADRVLLQRVFNNILTNCARYSDGELHVRVNENGTVIFPIMHKVLVMLKQNICLTGFIQLITQKDQLVWVYPFQDT